jgi:spore coat polysaccharide biosynthesis protein SpsF
VESTGIVLQARIGSTRLPGKVLASIGGRSMLEHCVRRLAHCGLPLVVATTDRDEDLPIAHAAGSLGVAVYRGPADDVLGRFVGAAQTFGFTEIIRATADNPFVDLDAPLRTSRARRRAAADHAVERGLPVGTAVEAVSRDALVRAHALATEAYDREHVTSLVRRDPRFRALRAVAPGHLRESSLRLTVDTAGDLATAREIDAVLAGRRELPGLAAIIQAAEQVLRQSLTFARTKRGA